MTPTDNEPVHKAKWMQSCVMYWPILKCEQILHTNRFNNSDGTSIGQNKANVHIQHAAHSKMLV